jgi:hypothetical protein
MEMGSSPDVPTRSTYPYNIFFLFCSGGVQVYHGSEEFSRCASEEYLPYFSLFCMAGQARSGEVSCSPAIFRFCRGGVQENHGSGEFSRCANEEYLPLQYFFSIVEESRCIMEVGSSPIVPARSTFLYFSPFL